MVGKLVALAPLLGGCDLLFGLDVVSRPDGGTDAPARCPFFDNFDDNMLDPEKWTVSDPTHAYAVVSEEGAELVMRPRALVNGGNGVASPSMSLVGKTVEVRVTPTTEVGFEETDLFVTLDANNALLVSTGATNLATRVYVNGAVTDGTNTPYDPLQHLHWRIRQDAGAGVVHFEASPDGVAWSPLGPAAPAPWSFASITISLAVFSFQGGTAMPGEAHFDNLAVCNPG